MSDPSRSEAGPVIKLFGALLMAVGVLIAVLSGLCSLAFLGTAILNVVQHPSLNAQGVAIILPLVFVIGGIPVAIGVGLVILGRQLFRG